ncbi:MAG: UPF0280 family protein [Deltaproteobacteria bacterium]|nr:UPF0280 family protein [Deltaproteobacteria bacterium]
MYRSLVRHDRLETFRVAVKETDLLVSACKGLADETRNLILKHRMPLERYLQDHPQFLSSLMPLAIDRFAPPIVQTMIKAGRTAGVGPMASVAGALAEYVGMDLLEHSDEVIVENGGDVFIRSENVLTVAIFAGASRFSNKIGVRIHAPGGPIGVCTSSGTVGHSLSFGKADAVVVVSDSTPLADAAATAIGNLLHEREDMAGAIERAKQIAGVSGVVIVMGDELAVAGQVELVKL